nr:uncharacterized protein LOC113738192 [Coffea arabica]
MGHHMASLNLPRASSRGPLSPALFIIGAEVLSSASVKSLRLVKQVLSEYEAVSGQRINARKSCFLVHPKASSSKRLGIQRVTGFSYKTFQIKYLGFPLYCGRRKKDFFGGMCQTVLLRLLSWQNRLLSHGGRIVLLKHVLLLCATYMLMAASPPKSVFKEIEGGVGFRLLEDIYRAFSIKLWWNFRSRSSLWASFMHAKFCRMAHPNLVFSEKGSEGWRRMVKVRVLAERHIGWIVRSESSNFWFDNWLGTGGLAARLDSVSDHKVADFVQNGAWDIGRISQWVPPGIVAEIGRILPPKGSLPDLMIWQLEPSGCFTLKTAFSLIQHHSGSSPLFNRIWHPGVPLRVSFFLLRLLRDRLPLDCSLWRLGIHGPSRCSCCPSPKIEATEHVFGAGVMAQYVWRFFGAPVGARNEMKYEGKRFVGAQVCRLIFSEMIQWFRIQFPDCQVPSWSWDQFYLAISTWKTVFSHRLVRWVRPVHGSLKLNTDGCSKGNPGLSGGGGTS